MSVSLTPTKPNLLFMSESQNPKWLQGEKEASGWEWLQTAPVLPLQFLQLLPKKVYLEMETFDCITQT